MAIAAFGYALIALVCLAALRRMPDLYAIAALVPAFSFFTAGVIALRARPNSPLARLLLAAGLFALCWPSDAFAGTPALLTLTAAFSNVWVGLIVHFLLAFPSGHLTSTPARVAAAAVYVVVLPLSMLAVLDFDPSTACATCSSELNVLYVGFPAWLTAVHGVVFDALTVAMGVLVTLLLVRRWRDATVPGRRLLAPVVLSGAVGAALNLAVNVVALFTAASGRLPALWGTESEAYSTAAAVFGAATLPVAAGYLVGVLRTRVTRSTVGQLVVALSEATEPEQLRDPLARALGDDSLEVVFWAPALEAFVDPRGGVVPLPEVVAGRAVTPVRGDGRPLAALIHDPAVLDDDGLVDAVAGAARLAIERAQLQAEVRAQLSAVRESRARIVAAGDEQRRKIERDLHDGAQQRLVTLALSMKLLTTQIRTSPDLAEQIAESAAADARAALEELRELAQGLHPQVLTQDGLAAAAQSLAERLPLPVDLDLQLSGRLPEPVEACAYFVCSEALANVVKYAHATRASLRLRTAGGLLVVEVEDDGIGGASIEGGTGLRGIVDRVEALGGRLGLTSEPGAGTRLVVTVPTEPLPEAARPTGGSAAPPAPGGGRPAPAAARAS